MALALADIHWQFSLEHTLKVMFRIVKNPVLKSFSSLILFCFLIYVVFPVLKLFERDLYFSMRKKLSTHYDNRKKICVVCFAKYKRSDKSKFTPIISQGKIETMIQRIFEYEASDERFPNAICGKCLRILYRDGDLVPPNLSQLTATPLTGSSEMSPCKCKLCEIARKSGLGAVRGTTSVDKPQIKILN